MADEDQLLLRVRRLRILQVLLSFVMTLLTLRLAFMQIGLQWKYMALANRNRVDAFATPAPRGAIFDRHMRTLAYDRPSFSLIYTRTRRSVEPMARLLGPVVGLSPADLSQRLSERSSVGVHTLVASRVSARVLSFVREHQRDLPGIQVIPDSTRVYPYDDVACHIIGYLNSIPRDRQAEYVREGGFPASTKVGWSGVELSFDHTLRGTPGRICVEVNSRGVPVRELPESHPAARGKNIVLTIDAVYQSWVQRVLSRQIDHLRRHGHQNVNHAMAVALDPRTGDILAMASVPTYHPQWLVDGISYGTYIRRFAPAERNWAMQAPIAPGSVMKPLTALFALSERAITPDQELSCEGAWQIPRTDGPPIRCWTAHQDLSLADALAQSCDVYFYKTSLRYGHWPPPIGADVARWLKVGRLEALQRMERFERAFGLGGGTGVDLPAEAIGYVNEESGQVTDLPYTAIGQNEVFTTLELATYAATIANDGIRALPRVVMRVLDHGGAVPVRRYPAAKRTGVTVANLHAVQQGMYLACNDPRGTAYATFHTKKRASYVVAGKTGTAETGVQGFDNAVFIGYAPYKQPRIAIAVVIPGGGHGADSTGPVARAMFDRFFAREAGKAQANVE